MDGTLADLSSAYAEVEERLFGSADDDAKHPAPEAREQEQQTAAASAVGEEEQDGPRTPSRTVARSRERVWRAIEATPDFWTTLKPLERDAIVRLYQLTLELKWEVFFITQRPATAGGTVQWQTHTWLVEQGFKAPNVIPLSGGRGKAAAALRLDYLIDDTPQNCMDVLSDSSARSILLVSPDDPRAESSARRLGIGVAQNVHEVLDLLVQANAARANPTLFEKLRKLVGWK